MSGPVTVTMPGRPRTITGKQSFGQLWEKVRIAVAVGGGLLACLVRHLAPAQ